MGVQESLKAIQAAKLYARSMIIRRLVLSEDWEIMRVIWSADNAFGTHLRTPLGGIISMPEDQLPALP